MTGQLLPQLPFTRDGVLDIAPKSRSLLGEQPIARVRTVAGGEAWLVTRYRYVRELFADHRLGRSHPEPENAARINNFLLLAGPQGDIESEYAEHKKMRNLLTPAFSPRRMRVLQGRIHEIVHTMLDEMARTAPPVDLHSRFSFPLPVQVICELLGVPFEDRDKFQQWAFDLGNMYDAELSKTAYERFETYMADLVEAKRRSPADDLISDLVGMADDDQLLTTGEIVRFAVILLFAGHETTVAYIDFGTLFMLINPEQLAMLRSQPELLPQAVEEILRIVALGSTGLPRYAHSDIEIDGHLIKKGEAVLLAANVANRDPDAFEAPDAVDITAKRMQHMSFGYGPRHCLGAALARAELTAVFGTLFQKFPDLRLAVPVEELELGRTHMLEGLTRLPVEW